MDSPAPNKKNMNAMTEMNDIDCTSNRRTSLNRFMCTFHAQRTCSTAAKLRPAADLQFLLIKIATCYHSSSSVCQRLTRYTNLYADFLKTKFSLREFGRTSAIFPHKTVKVIRGRTNELEKIKLHILSTKLATTTRSRQLIQ